MKLTDKIVEKVGTDKLLHFLVSALVVSLAGHFGDISATIAYVLMFILGITKEQKLDDQVDYWDLGYAMIGGAISLLVCWVS